MTCRCFTANGNSRLLPLWGLTRAASAHGLAVAEDLGRSLASMGWPVISGLAEGIDAAAHQGCLDAGGRPVAVLGTALERVYP